MYSQMSPKSELCLANVNFSHWLTSESVRSTMDFLLVSRELESGLCLSMSSQGFIAFFLDLGPGLYLGLGGELGEELLLLLASLAESCNYTV